MEDKDNKGSIKSGIITAGLLLLMIGGSSALALHECNYVKIAEKVVDIPILNNVFTLSEEQIVEKTVAELEGKVKDLQAQLDTITTQKTSLEQERDTLKERVNELRVYKEQQDSFEAMKLTWEEQVMEDNTELFKQVFEEFNPDLANKIYTELTADNIVTQEQKEYSKVIAGMEDDKAASTLSSLMSDNSELVIVILKGMNKERQSNILSQMDSNLSATIVEKLYESTGVKN